MVKFGGVVICLLIVAIDVAAGILGIQAEIAQNQVNIRPLILDFLSISWFSFEICVYLTV